MDLLSIFLVSFTIALSGALMPGTLLTAVISESTKHGFKSGPLIIIGHALAEALMMGLIILGFAHFINKSQVVLYISIIGSFILFYFGTTMLISLPRLSLVSEDKPSKSSNLILLGITMSITNPYWSIWWLTIGLGLALASQRQGLPAVLIFFLGHISADFGWYSAVSLGISKSRKFLSDKIYRGIIFLCGIALIGFGIYFGLSAFRSGF
jgi:threonine/homoserine/homoserine lactone efflux protein